MVSQTIGTILLFVLIGLGGYLAGRVDGYRKGMNRWEDPGSYREPGTKEHRVFAGSLVELGQDKPYMVWQPEDNRYAIQVINDE